MQSDRCELATLVTIQKLIHPSPRFDPSHSERANVYVDPTKFFNYRPATLFLFLLRFQSQATNGSRSTILSFYALVLTDKVR